MRSWRREKLAPRRLAQSSRSSARNIRGLRPAGNPLEEILSHRSYTTESVKRLFKPSRKGQTRDFNPVGVFADFVEVDPKYEKAAEEFLHEELEYVVVKDWEQADQGIA